MSESPSKRIKPEESVASPTEASTEPGTSTPSGLSSNPTGAEEGEAAAPISIDPRQYLIATFPPEVLKLIFSWLYINESLKLRGVSRQWKWLIEEICSGKRSLKLFVFAPGSSVVPFLKNYIDVVANAQLADKVCYTRRLSFCSSKRHADLLLERTQLTPDLVRLLGELFPNIRDLVFASNSYQARGLPELLQLWLQLEQLTFFGRVNVDVAVLTAIRNLRRLTQVNLLRRPETSNLHYSFTDLTFPTTDANINPNRPNCALRQFINELQSGRDGQCNLLMSLGMCELLPGSEAAILCRQRGRAIMNGGSVGIKFRTVDQSLGEAYFKMVSTYYRLQVLCLAGFEPREMLSDLLTLLPLINSVNFQEHFSTLTIRINLNIRDNYEIHVPLRVRRPITTVKQLHLIDDVGELTNGERCCTALATMFPNIRQLLIESKSKEVRSKFKENRGVFRKLESLLFRSSTDKMRWFGRHRRRVEADEATATSSK